MLDGGIQSTPHRGRHVPAVRRQKPAERYGKAAIPPRLKELTPAGWMSVPGGRADARSFQAESRTTLVRKLHPTTSADRVFWVQLA